MRISYDVEGSVGKYKSKFLHIKYPEDDDKAALLEYMSQLN